MLKVFGSLPNVFGSPAVSYLKLKSETRNEQVGLL